MNITNIYEFHSPPKKSAWKILKKSLNLYTILQKIEIENRKILRHLRKIVANKLVHLFANKKRPRYCHIFTKHALYAFKKKTSFRAKYYKKQKIGCTGY